MSERIYSDLHLGAVDMKNPLDALSACTQYPCVNVVYVHEDLVQTGGIICS